MLIRASVLLLMFTLIYCIINNVVGEPIQWILLNLDFFHPLSSLGNRILEKPYHISEPTVEIA